MLKINEFKFSSYDNYIDLRNIDKQIRADLNSIESVPAFQTLLNNSKFKNDWDALKSLPSYTMLNLAEITNLELIILEQNLSTKIGITQDYKTHIEQLRKIDSDTKKGEAILNTTATVKSLLQQIFDYKGRRPQILQFYQKLNLKNCLYCLAQSTIIYENGKNGSLYLKGNLDHIKSQTKYPYLSVTINNLIPVCAHCNQRKSSNDLQYSPFSTSPRDTHLQLFNFTNALTITPKMKYALDLTQMKIESSAIGSLADKLNLLELYKCYSDDLNNLIERFQKFNSESYKKHITSISGNSVDYDLEYFISELPYSNDNLLKVPLHKFKSDFFTYLKDLKKNGKLSSF